LLTVAIALFGYDSFVPTRLAHPEQFIRDYDSYPKANGGDTGPWVDYANACTDQKPLSSLLMGPLSQDSISYDCISAVRYPEVLDCDIALYVQSLCRRDEHGPDLKDPKLSTNAFAAAVYLATETWLTSDVTPAYRKVFADPEFDVVIPAISRSGMVLISVLWVVYIACLFSLAVYSARTPRWTHQLDSFAMLRIGAAANEHIRFDVGFERDAIDALDELPGSFGDATGGEGAVGALGLGASTPLRSRRKYKCYSGDEEEARRKHEAQNHGAGYDIITRIM
jgi:hypothetical protein